MSDEGQTSAVKNWLSNHPEIIGYMFAIMMLSQSAMSVAAKGGFNGT